MYRAHDPGTIAQAVAPHVDGTSASVTDQGAVCDHCLQGMLVARTCILGILLIAGKQYRRDRAPVVGPDGRCGDCNIADGGIHHLGCDLERCPRCGGQLISCGCLDGGYRLEAERRR